MLVQLISVKLNYKIKKIEEIIHNTKITKNKLKKLIHLQNDLMSF